VSSAYVLIANYLVHKNALLMNVDDIIYLIFIRLFRVLILD